jgi:hypothetical protein
VVSAAIFVGAVVVGAVVVGVVADSPKSPKVISAPVSGSVPITTFAVESVVAGVVAVSGAAVAGALPPRT